MCKYCDEEKERENIDNNGEIKIKINEEMGNNLEIDYYWYGAKVGRYIPIAFCPMCGRLVNKEVLDNIKKLINNPQTGMQVAQQTLQDITPDNKTMTDIQKELNEAITKQLAVDPLKLFDTGNTSELMRGAMM